MTMEAPARRGRIKPKKYHQTATCYVLVVVNRSDTYEDVRGWITESGTLTVRKRDEQVNQNQRMIAMDVSYKAKSANRNDVSTRIEAIFTDENNHTFISKASVVRTEDA